MNECDHRDCWRKAVRVVGYEKPDHAEFKGQTHDCCNVHSRPPKDASEPVDPASLTYCDEPECEATIKSNRWAHTKSGWFFQRDGLTFCTEHIPDWVEEWRAQRDTSATDDVRVGVMTDA